MKVYEIAQQWKESTLSGFNVQAVKSNSRRQSSGSGNGIAHLYSYNDERDEEVPVAFTFDYEFGFSGSYDEPSYGGSAEITSAKLQNGQEVPLNTFKYDENDLLQDIQEYVNDSRYSDYSNQEV